METVSEIYDMNELFEGMFNITFDIIGQYQLKDTSIMAKTKCVTYKYGYFCGGRNINYKLILCKDF